MRVDFPQPLRGTPFPLLTSHACVYAFCGSDRCHRSFFRLSTRPRFCFHRYRFFFTSVVDTSCKRFSAILCSSSVFFMEMLFANRGFSIPCELMNVSYRIGRRAKDFSGDVCKINCAKCSFWVSKLPREMHLSWKNTRRRWNRYN